jgi:Uma2 family endonuclease
VGSRVILTYKDYEALPSDGRRYELQEGNLSVTPAPGLRHQRVSLKLSMLLENHAVPCRMGSDRCSLPPSTVS